MSTPKSEIAKTYLKHLANGNAKEILALFAEDAIVSSPLMGEMTAKDFYTSLGELSEESILDFNAVYENGSEDSVALYFNYHWKLAGGSETKFDVVDIMYFNKDNKIKELKIIYDASLTRDLLKF